MKRPSRKTFPAKKRGKRPQSLHEWVAANNPSEDKEYGKGWWDTIEFLYDLLSVFPRSDARVIETFVMQTPPPVEELLMPVVRLRLPTARVVLKREFPPLPPDWTVSVACSAAGAILPCGLFDRNAAVPASDLAVFPVAWRFGTYAKNRSRFCCQIDDEYRMFTLLWILGHGMRP